MKERLAFVLSDGNGHPQCSGRHVPSDEIQVGDVFKSITGNSWLITHFSSIGKPLWPEGTRVAMGEGTPVARIGLILDPDRFWCVLETPKS